MIDFGFQQDPHREGWAIHGLKAIHNRRIIPARPVASATRTGPDFWSAPLTSYC